MPAGREARPPRSPRVAVAPSSPDAGRGIVRASLGGTALLAVTSIAAAVAPDRLGAAALAVAVAMFVGGVAAFVWAYLVAVGRSRTDDIGLAGVFGLAGSTPDAVRARLLGSLAAEVVVALVTAGVRLHSTLAFGVLAVMWGLGTAGLWGARYGAFPARQFDGRGGSGGGRRRSR